MITGLTPSTYDKLQLNAGVFFKNLDWSSATDAASLKALIAGVISGTTTNNGVCLGATRGGGTFECTPDTREVEADGARMPFVGSTINDGWTVQLTTTLIECTAENLKLALGSADATTSGNITTLTLRTDYAATDYIDKVCWIGDTSAGVMLIEIDNALSTGGLNFTFTDKGEGTIPLTLVAHQDSVDNQGTAPCRIALIAAS